MAIPSSLRNAVFTIENKYINVFYIISAEVI